MVPWVQVHVVPALRAGLFRGCVEPCRGLQVKNVLCTINHFPPLSRTTPVVSLDPPAPSRGALLTTAAV